MESIQYITTTKRSSNFHPFSVLSAFNRKSRSQCIRTVAAGGLHGGREVLEGLEGSLGLKIAGPTKCTKNCGFKRCDKIDMDFITQAATCPSLSSQEYQKRHHNATCVPHRNSMHINVQNISTQTQAQT